MNELNQKRKTKELIQKDLKYKFSKPKMKKDKHVKFAKSLLHTGTRADNHKVEVKHRDTIIKI